MFAEPLRGPVVVEGEMYILQCTAKYTGDDAWAPRLEWRDPNGVIHGGIGGSANGLTDYFLSWTASPEQDQFVYSGIIHFQAFRGSLPNDTASNVPTYTSNHTFEPVTVLCKKCCNCMGASQV